MCDLDFVLPLVSVQSHLRDNARVCVCKEDQWLNWMPGKLCVHLCVFVCDFQSGE